MKRKLFLFIITMLIITALIGCSGGIKQGSMEDTAKTFVQAMINGDEKVLDEINKSGPLSFPTHYLISDFAPKYADLKISALRFDVNQEKNTVTITKKDEDKPFATMEIKKVGDKYYFMSF